MTVPAKIDVRLWKGGSEGFFRWLDDVRPMVPSSKGGFEPYVPGPLERIELTTALDGGYRTIVLCWPRRHGKTLAAALIIAWRFMSRRTQNVAMVANSERQSVDVAFKLVRDILRETPYAAAMVKADKITIAADKIEYPALGNVIQGFPSNPAALFGKKLSIAQVSELHAATSDAAYQALASATIDSDDGLVLVDSTVGSRSSPLYGLYGLHERATDPSLFFSHIAYRDLEDACARAPRWISVAGLRSRAAQMLPGEFAQQHLNLWGSSTTSLFPPAVLDQCRGTYKLDIASITGGAAHVVGAGLDRAYGFSLHGDATVASCVVKVLVGEDPHYYVLASDKIAFSAATGIRRAFTRYRTEHGMSRAAIESYNSQDIAAWCGDQTFDHEVISPTLERQGNAFTALYAAAAEGRLHVAPGFSTLLAEMGMLEYQLGASSAPRFEAAKGYHDDHVYALAWAVYALRDVELNPYELKGVHCYGPGPSPSLCILNGGELVPPCAGSCRSMLAARDLYRGYLGRGPLVPVDFPEFVAGKVVNVGAHTMPR
ncbi:terminase large subunit [Methylobacterium sp. 88A]|uniref:terminase large subunit domain-containing protein n=1 Tax=Methylobacterium sp. 88A TaxID=1131813 RepID=UPI00037481C1|nr:terminase large subunit [Methylobacterium sp. 88A]